MMFATGIAGGITGSGLVQLVAIALGADGPNPLISLGLFLGGTVLLSTLYVARRQR